MSARVVSGCVRSGVGQEATEPTFITPSTIFSYPLGRRFSIYTADFHRALLSFCLIYSLFPRRSDFRNFPSSRPIIAIVAPFRLIGHVETITFGKFDDKLPIDIVHRHQLVQIARRISFTRRFSFVELKSI